MSVLEKAAKIRIRRENGLNVFEFEVEDPEQAFTAVLDVPQFFSTGHVFETQPRSPEKWDSLVEAFLVTGFPCTSTTEELAPALISGRQGTVGATYRHMFPTDAQGDGCISVQTQVIEIVRQDDFMEVVFHHQSEGSCIRPIGCDCFESPEIPPPKTETRVQIRLNANRTWTLKLIYNGMGVFNPRETQGTANYWGLMSMIGLFCPCTIPFLPCMIAADFTEAATAVKEQMARVRQYCNTYKPKLSATKKKRAKVQEPKPLETKKLDEIPVESESSSKNERKEKVEVETEMEILAESVKVVEEPKEAAAPKKSSGFGLSEDELTAFREAEIDKWYQLYKTGAMSEEEFEAEKARIMSIM